MTMAHAMVNRGSRVGSRATLGAPPEKTEQVGSGHDAHDLSASEHDQAPEARMT
jgi:hypothetical protein